MAAFGVISFLLTSALLFASIGELHAKLVPKSKAAGAGPYASVMLRKSQKLVQLLNEGKGKESTEISLRDYRELVFDSPRNHTAFVLFYEDDNICDSCDVAVQAFDRIARSFLQHYAKFDKKTSLWDPQIPVFFLKIKMSEGYRNMFVDLHPSKPSIFYFAPAWSSKYNQFEQMNQEELVPELGSQFNAERIMGFIEHVSGVRVPLEKQSPPSETLSNILSATLVGIMVLYNIYHFGYWELFVNSFKEGNCSYLITIIVIWLLSGQMFNYIRYTPLFGNYGFSVMSLIYPGMRSQYGSESIIIMILYAMIMYAITTLVETRERQLSENLPMRQVQGSILGALSGFYFGFMGLQFISQIKTGR